MGSQIIGFGQTGFNIKLKKPAEYEERILRSEKSDGKKLSLPGRFIQNTTSHYNYAFNAQKKLNEVLQRAKEGFQDDYSKLLPFYNYTLDATAKDSLQLDSIIIKSSSGIALHDLRSDWADNLYLLWGASYYLQKKFDSAYQLFQFMNYAFAPKEKDGYYKTIGSARDGNSAKSIATKEKRNIAQKLLSEPPSRNDAFIWQIRNYLAQDKFPEAASLIVVLKNDPVFPKRLYPDLEEVQALFFYKQEQWDSAASHLSQALENAPTQQERARWEFLTGQLYELSGSYKDAKQFYGRSIPRTTDLIMEIYARLAEIRCTRDEASEKIDKNVSTLIKMAQRDKYVDYRDIIYYMAAQMDLAGGNKVEAKTLLLKSTTAGSNNPHQRNKAFLQLAEMAYSDKLYRESYNYYDSIQLPDSTLANSASIKSRKASLELLAANIDIIKRQDSLQRIASMPEEERKDFVKRVLKQLRKQQGLKDDGSFSTGNPFQSTSNNTLFQPIDSKADWYFYNASLRTRGQLEFKGKWGNRPNVDNWRRSAAVSSAMANNAAQNNNVANTGSQNGNTNTGNSDELSYESLYDKLPIGEEKLKLSNDTLQNALFEAGKILIQEIEDCSAGTAIMDTILNKFPAYENLKDVYFNLYYCYNKNGETEKAKAIKELMQTKFPNEKTTRIITSGRDQEAESLKAQADQRYSEIYTLFLDGKYAEAIGAKKLADSLYGNSYWTPQLMYIEAVYFIKQNADSLAKPALTEITNRFPSHPITEKANALLTALTNRKTIEAQLTNQQTQTAVIVKKDSTSVQSNITSQPATLKGYLQDPNSSHLVLLVLTKVDPGFVNESKRSFERYNRENFPNRAFTLDLTTLDQETRILSISSFGNLREASAYMERTNSKLATDILSWLTGGKYELQVISLANWQFLQSEKDIEAYKKWLK